MVYILSVGGGWWVGGERNILYSIKWCRFDGVKK